jgi:hypothetical protein
MTSVHLLPCPACARHVRASAPSCPFCGGATLDDFRKHAPPVGPRARLSRAALRAFGASALTLAAVGCGGSSTTIEDGGVSEDGSVNDGSMKADGGVRADGSGDECHPLVTAYGGPPPGSPCGQR